jgi:hypothetical protein
MDGQPGDKSPGYYRVSLRDEVPGKVSLERAVRRVRYDRSAANCPCTAKGVLEYRASK